MRSKLVVLVGAAIAATLVSFGSAIPAQAHAQLLASNPQVSATLYQSPKAVTLTFDDDLLLLENGNQIQVRDPKRRVVDLGNSAAMGATVSVSLKKLTVWGKYSVAYHVISADGHPVTGSYSFYLAKKKS
ncbi:MAG: copper resistance protein CopC [Actinomycetales bacterium]|nr:copper resistance protein CopC [Actinomycetales bacterium]